jgi:hypothetical protein
MSTMEDIKNNHQASIVVVLKDQPTRNSALVTTLECMPNEFLTELFDLFIWYSRYYSFSSLNSRFDAVPPLVITPALILIV